MTGVAWRTADVLPLPAADGDGRTLTVRLAPWDTAATVDDGAGPYVESLARGSLEAPADRTVPVFAGHDPISHARGPLIGRAHDFADRDDGLYASLRIADTAAGRDALALLTDEVVTGVSVEFTMPDAGARARPGGAVHRKGPLPLTGVALVVNPAYQSARILAARSEGNAMTVTDTPVDPQPQPQPDPDPQPDPAPAGDDAAVLEAARAAAAGRGVQRALPGPVQHVAPVRARSRYRSYGEFVAATAPQAMRGDVDTYAEHVYRALADEITDDVPGLIREAWIGEVKGLLDLARPTVNVFSTSPLPKGDPIVWPEVTQLPPVGPQDAEKAEVVTGKMLIARRTTDIVTYGGGQDVSIQVIQRSQPSYIDTLMKAYAGQMAYAMNAAAVAYVDANTTSTDVDLGATPADWVAGLADADTQVFQAVRVPPDLFVAGLGIRNAFLAAVDSDGRPLFGGIQPFNNVGTLQLGDVGGNVRGVTVVFDPSIAPLEGYVGWSGAFNTFLSPVGNLAADNPGQLGRDVAVYQMAAFALYYPKGIVKVTMPPPAGARAGSAKK